MACYKEIIFLSNYIQLLALVRSIAYTVYAGELQKNNDTVT